MVMWMFCPDCKKPVDQFEKQCHYCQSKSGPKELREFWKNLGQKPSQQNFEEIFKGIEEKEGERIAVVCRGIVSKLLSQSKQISDWDAIVNAAHSVLNPTRASDEFLKSISTILNDS